MATVASLQIKIGADVSAAINGLSKAQFAADQVNEAYSAASVLHYKQVDLSLQDGRKISALP